MLQRFSRPDPYLRRCGRLDCDVHQWRIEGAPAFMRGLKALFVTDTHVRPDAPDGAIRAFVEKLAALAPDILLLGGDFADRREDALRLFDALDALRPPLGAYACLGNNDAEAWESAHELSRAMKRRGMKLLVNAAARVELNGGRLVIGGVDERKYGAPQYAGLIPDAAAGNVYRILLSHFPCAPDMKCDLMLSGHTHGGQFNLLGVTPYTVGFERVFPQNMAVLASAGLFETGGMKLLVSKGVGASRIPWRVGVRPEIDLIVFG